MPFDAKMWEEEGYLERVHGVRIEVEPAPLSELGERLLGLRRWE